MLKYYFMVGVLCTNCLSYAMERPATQPPIACAICHEPEIRGNKLTLSCKHEFCEPCINEWRERQGHLNVLCPLCRQPVPPPMSMERWETYNTQRTRNSFLARLVYFFKNGPFRIRPWDRNCTMLGKILGNCCYNTGIEVGDANRRCIENTCFSPNWCYEDDLTRRTAFLCCCCVNEHPQNHAGIGPRERAFLGLMCIELELSTWLASSFGETSPIQINYSEYTLWQRTAFIQNF